ncbi:MAG: helix-turn-helix transcriptional regulator [Deltaproteobacteria bacterium]|nr:helix-turn-helix transcriptional regulator [Candidatus Zymogenaceae bacterium]
MGCTIRNTLCREFHSRVGKSIGTYVRELRINLAERLLTQTALPVTQIAFRCGYEDSSHFSRVFKTLTKSSPLRWRSDQRSS